MFFHRISLFTLLFLSLSATSAFAGTNSYVQTLETPQLIAQSFDDEADFGPRHRGSRRGELIDQLDLSDTQKNELQRIRNEYQPRFMEQREALFEARQTLRNMMVDDNASNSDLRQQHDKILSLRDEMGNLRFESMLEMREVLTPEQREDFAELMDERRGNWGRGRRGRGPGFRGGRFNNEF
ncbi:MAG: periplasmic heavy metal sensor [Cyanobacteria bacterium]|jgi:Spy/CpxP family protein refolding chaperone|nr:periplasmic heavy metal sensor [Cyanobacteria bacterium GSL.Bin1]